MIHSLQQLFKNRLITSNEPMNFDTYEWFRSNDQYIGIEKTELTPREIILLQTFLEPVKHQVIHMSDIENWWKAFLYQEEEIDLESLEQDLLFSETDSFRFIQFRFNKPFLQTKSWKEAVSAFFESEIEIVWKDQVSGLIIEEKTNYDESIDYMNLIEITASDFYESIKLFIGSFHPFSEKIPQFLHLEEACFSMALKYNRKDQIFSFEQTMPYLLINQIDDRTYELLRHSFLHTFPTEEDLLQNVKVYIENNLNVSLTAKKLYLHRNSVQYRIDKFIEKTGLDIKNFQGAFIAYLAILIIENENMNG